MNIVLASASAGRKKLLEDLGLKFEVVPSNIDEEKFTAASPLALVKKIAKAKAIAVLASLSAHNSYLIIAADSMVVFRGQTYGKPTSRNEAKRVLKMLAGKSHFFISGLCLLDTNTHKLYQASAKTQVTFQKFTDKEIDKYVQTSDVTSHAGGYATEDEFIKSRVKLIGSETNVVGLPLEKLLPILKKVGIEANT